MKNLQLIESITLLHLDEKESEWFQQKLNTVRTNNSSNAFYLAFASVHRFISKDVLNFSSSELAELNSIYPSFNKTNWSKDEFCRLTLVLSLPIETNTTYLEKLFQTADLRELVILYKSLYLLDNASKFEKRVAEGVRTNMLNVFDAIALNNPFASKYMEEDSWNQMVLKSIFMQRPIYQILGIQERNNHKLAAILSDYAHERWAASRVITPELWRMMSGFVNDQFFADLKRVIETDSEIAQAAAIKAIEESEHQASKDWLQKNNIPPSKYSWEEIGELTEKILI